MSQQPVGAGAAIALAGRVNLLLALVAPIAARPRAVRAVALVDFGIGVAELDGDVADQLVLEADGLDTRDGLDDSRLAVSHVTDCADVDGRLPGNNLGGERGQAGDIEVLGVGLRGQRGPLDSLVWNGRVGVPEGRLEGLLLNSIVAAVKGLARVGFGLDVVEFGVAVGRHGG